MARSKMTEKLDSITHGELGIQFDEGLVWERLESRLGGERKTVHYRWMIAAAIFMGVLFIPFTILKKEVGLSTIETLSDQVIEVSDPAKDVESPMAVVQESKSIALASHELLNVESVKVEIEEAGIIVPTFSKISVEQPVQKRIKPQFAVEDISVIQGSLENASINDRRIQRGRTMSIRAHGHNSPIDKVDEEQYQGLKIKLYEQKN